MTLELRSGINIKTNFDNIVHIDNLEMSLEDFLNTAYYVLTNTDLEPNDPRLGFIEVVKEMVQATGYNKNSRKLDYKGGWSLAPPKWSKE